MLFSDSTITKEYERLISLYPDSLEYNHPLINISDVLRAYFTLADYFTDPSSNSTETMLVGLRMDGQEPYYTLIQDFEGPLRRLKDE